MKKMHLFLAILIIAASSMVYTGCDDNPLVGDPINSNVAVQAIANVYGLDIMVIGGRAVVPPDRQVAFDASRSQGPITKYLWTFVHPGQANWTDTNKTFLRMFTAVPDSFQVTLKVWGNLLSDTSSTTFTLVIQNGGGGVNECYIESSILLANGKKVNTIVLPMRFIPNGPFDQPTLYGNHAPWWSWGGVRFALDSVNGGYRLKDTTYDNGGYAMNYSGVPNGSWAIASQSVFKKPGTDNLFWFDPRGGVLYGWGQPAFTLPGSIGDTSYLNGVMRNSFTSSVVNLFINVRTGNAGPTTTPTYQYSSSITNWTTANLNMINSSGSGWGPGSVNFTSIGTDNILKVRPGNNIVITNSMYYVPSEAALVVVVIQPMRLILPLIEARARGYSNATIDALLAANPTLR